MNIKQKEILLVPFPFSDFSGEKVRPVLVVSKDQFNESSEDVIVCGITNNTIKKTYTIQISNEHLEEGHLFNPCCVKAENILKINKRLLIKKIGTIKNKTFFSVLEKIDSLFR
ncbi:MAG: type II toxin-antitoxin system PemK/MazF family toxin [archaeon]